MLTFNSELEIAFKELFFKYYIFVQPKRITHWPSSEFDFQGSGWGRPQVIQAAFTSRFVDTWKAEQMNQKFDFFEEILKCYIFYLSEKLGIWTQARPVD